MDEIPFEKPNDKNENHSKRTDWESPARSICQKFFVGEQSFNTSSSCDVTPTHTNTHRIERYNDNGHDDNNDAADDDNCSAAKTDFYPFGNSLFG